MRIIKFRAWKKDEKEWLQHSGHWNIEDLNSDELYIWMQFKVNFQLFYLE